MPPAASGWTLSGDPKVLNAVRTTDADEQIGQGTHERFVVDVDRFLARAGAKS